MISQLLYRTAKLSIFKCSLQPIELVSNPKQNKPSKISGLEGEYSKTFISHSSTSGLLPYNPKSLNFGTRKPSQHHGKARHKCSKEPKKIAEGKHHESNESIFDKKAKYKYNIRRMELLNYNDSLH